MKITVLEQALLTAIMDSDYNAGSGYYNEECIGNQVWTFDPVDNFGRAHGSQKTSGVLSSLLQKGAVEQGSYEQKHDVLAITREGYDALVAAGWQPRVFAD